MSSDPPDDDPVHGDPYRSADEREELAWLDGQRARLDDDRG